MTKKKVSVKGIWEVIKATFSGFSDHKVTKLCGSLAYYTVFSMAPLLVVVIALCGIFLGREAAEGQVYGQLAGFLGKSTALQLEEVIKSAFLNGKSTVALVIGLIGLLITSTTVFSDMQDSINTIWGIKPKPKRGWLKFLKTRFLSFSIIISLAFILLVSLALTAVFEEFSARIFARFQEVSIIVAYVINQFITLAIVALIFGVIFKVLPDAKIKWRDVISGSIITAILFMIGKFLISLYITKTNVGGTYGAAGSLVVLLSWTYYTAIILYLGAEFTKAYAVAYGDEIRPAEYAVTTKEIEVETGNKSIQENGKELQAKVPKE